jgi:DNA helicase-2/ATP-dependent DNA helicase PcrA
MQVARLIGAAGSGKTTTLLGIMEKTLQAGVPDPFKIGFVSFTRAARAEASMRAAQKFGIEKASDLEREGWFKTLHAVCYRCLGVKSGDLLTDNTESRNWLKEALQEEVSGTGDGELGFEHAFDGATEADTALALWQTARNRLSDFRPIWQNARDCDPRVPEFEWCEEMIRRYESAKYQHDRMDFTDLLGMYAGFKFRIGGPEIVEPQGWVPEIPAWFLDEMQDCSALLHAVCLRVTSNAKWVYLVGDPFQSVFGFCGSDAKHFMSWPIAEGKQKIMPKSYRCAPDILAMGEAFLRGCSDYWDRGVAPADHDGQVQEAELNKRLIKQVNPEESWLLIGRTNFQAKRIAGLLDSQGIPWMSTKGNGGWDAPVRNAAMQALYDLEQGNPIDGALWQQVLKYLPSRAGVAELLVRGTKKKFEDLTAEQAEDRHPFVLRRDLHEVGGTSKLAELLVSRKWRELVEHAERYVYAVEKWGRDAVQKSNVRVGTIHSAKGSEATNVILSLGISRPIVNARQSQAGNDEEQRVFYVGATRARQRLILAHDRSSPYSMKIPA